MKKPSIYYTGKSEVCLACRHGSWPEGEPIFRCKKHNRNVYNAGCHRCRDWQLCEELIVDRTLKR